jgi:hypothetical protein
LSRALVAVAAFLAVVPAVSACGEDEQEAFSKDFRPLNKRIVDLGEQVATAVNEASKKTDQQIEDEFGRLAQRTGEVQQDVDELEPPDNLKAAKKDLVEAMGDAQQSLRDIEKAAGDSDPQAARSATIELISSSRDLGDARSKLERATRSSR